MSIMKDLNNIKCMINFEKKKTEEFIDVIFIDTYFIQLKCKYRGEYIENNIPHGLGNLIYNDEEKILNYSFEFICGEFDQGIANGKCKIKWSDDEYYDGDVVDNKRTGKGFYKFACGTTYTGDFIDGKRTGKGIYNWTNGSSYEGEIINDIKNGKGCYKTDEGKIYKGNFINGLLEGLAEITIVKDNKIVEKYSAYYFKNMIIEKIIEEKEENSIIILPEIIL